jgi:SNF2 family DNA or RNA helicase
MADRLFEFPSDESFSGSIGDVELSDLQKAVLKLLVFINHPRSRTEIKQLAGDILTSLPKYQMVKKSSIAACVDFFYEQDLFIHYQRGIGLHPDIVRELLPLAASHSELIGIAYEAERNRGYRASEAGKLKLAILSGDSIHVKREIHGSYYYHSSSAERLLNALLDLGDLSFIRPLLPELEETDRFKFLTQVPFYLPYTYLDQWDAVLFNQGTPVYREAFFNYLSCVSLILPRQKGIAIANKISVDPDSLFFAELLQGNTEKALGMASSWLQKLQEKEGHRRKELPGAFGIQYAIVLLVSGQADQLQMAATFLRSAKKQLPVFADRKNPFVQFAEILLMFINHRIGKVRVDGNTVYQAYQCPLYQHFLAAVLSWLGKPFKNTAIPPRVSEREEMEYRAAGLTPDGELDEESETRLRELEEKLQLIPLARLIQDEKPWEVLLSVLSASDGHTAKKKTEKESRLIWLVDPLDEYSLEAIEQKRNKTGWSKGTQRSLLGFTRTIPDFASPADIRIINTLQKDSYYATVGAKKWDDLLEALSEHPHVYTLSSPRLPLEIRMQEARIQIDKQGEGATVSLKPSSPYSRVHMESPTRYICTRWSSRALKVYRILNEQGLSSICIPADGMEKARPVIDGLGEHMPVTGDFASATVKTRGSANIPVLQLTPANDQLHVQLLIEVLKDEATLLVPGIGSSEMLVETSNKQVLNVRRDKDKEREIKEELAERISWLQEMKHISAQMFIEDDRDMLDFLSEMKEKAPEVKLIWPKGERLRVAKVLSYADISFDIKQDLDWFELDGEVRVDQELLLSVQQLLDKSEGGALKYVQLDDKTFVTIQKDLQKRLAALNSVANKKGQKLVVHPLGAGTLENLLADVPEVKTDKHWKEHIAKLDRLKSYVPGLPGNLKAELRNYQVEGVRWLDRLHEWGVGGCLADDMGLGKTIQAIGILLKYAKEGPSLVIAPLSVCANWGKEITRFAPTLNPRILKNHGREKTLEKLSAHDVLIASYGLIQSNPDLLAGRRWNIVVLDEAHAIKNSRSVRSKAVMKLEAKFRILTTGTPIQNHLGELWNLFQFMNPGMLGTRDQFLKKYGKGNGIFHSAQSPGAQSHSALNRYIAPFILRRNKSDVLDDLPEKTEITLHISLSEQERAMYEVLREKAIGHIEGSDLSGGSRHMQILSEITKLRQMSCNPLLIAPESKLPSSKLEALESLISDLLSANHKALIFSQFTRHLALIRKMLDQKGWSYQYLDGSTPAKKREEIIQDFQNGTSDLFLISLKAGGSGLNLTAADYVIHMDPWWNPAVEDQASDRAHRIGQTRPVTIYRLIAENTIEEKIVQLHHEKRDLADMLLSGTDRSAKISSEELFNLIVEKD